MVFVDEANVVSSARSFNRRFDWALLREYLASQSEGRELVEMVVYCGLPPMMDKFQGQREGKEKFIYWLKTNGFMVVTKVGAPTEGDHYRANIDVILAIDAVEMAMEVRPDIVVLGSGDADFAPLATALRRRGIRVEVASVAQSLGGELRASASGVIDLVPLFNKFDPLDDSVDAHAIGDNGVFSDR